MILGTSHSVGHEELQSTQVNHTVRGCFRKCVWAVDWMGKKTDEKTGLEDKCLSHQGESMA